MNLPQVPQISTDSISVAVYNSPTIQTIILGIFVFFLILLFALSRRFLVHSSMRGIHAGIVIGAIIILGIEAGILYGFKELTREDKGQFVPPNIKAMLSTGQKQVNQVLGAETERGIPTAQSVVLDYEDLGRLDAQLVKNSVCRSDNDIRGKIQ